MLGLVQIDIIFAHIPNEGSIRGFIEKGRIAF